MSHEHTAQEIWDLILKECSSRLSRQTISTWLNPSRAVSMLDGGLTVELKNKFTSYYVEQNYQETLNDVAVSVLQRPFEVNFVFKPEEQEQLDIWDFSRTESPRKEPDSRGNGTGGKKNSHKSDPSSGLVVGTLNPRYTFDDFVVGKNNQFAHAAALSVAEAPSNRYNPLFIYGGVGLGKTHIMQAVGHALLKGPNGANLKICYISAEEFLNELIVAIKSGSTIEFRNRYRHMDVLLMDDIEFLSKKEATQEEFFHTFNSLYENQKQIVMTSDRPPREIHHLEERLRSRFQCGLVADIQPPEFETRLAILRKKSELSRLIVPKKVLEFIAENITGSVRLLEGSLHYLKHYSDIQKSSIDLELAERVLKNIFEQEVNHISVDRIFKVVSDSFGVTEGTILSAKRTKSIVEPRQVAMFLCSKLTRMSSTEIAEKFKRKDHTTVLHACRKMSRRLEQDPDFKERLDGLVIRLKDRQKI